MQIPWKIKSWLFDKLGHFPPSALYFAQQHITGNARIRVTEPQTSWIFHQQIIEKTGASRLIEFGAGKSLIQNLFLSNLVDLQIVVDLNPMVDLKLVNNAINKLVEMGADIDGSSVRTLDELEEIYKIRYLAPYDMRHTGLPSDSIDLCISTNTLEHVPVQSIVDILIELSRVLKHDGSISAKIDYSDHYAHSDPSISRLNYLSYSEAEWEKHNHVNHYQNRLRHSHYRELFLEAGFEISFEECRDFCDAAGLHLETDCLCGDEFDFYLSGFWHLINMR